MSYTYCNNTLQFKMSAWQGPFLCICNVSFWWFTAPRSVCLFIFFTLVKSTENNNFTTLQWHKKYFIHINKDAHQRHHVSDNDSPETQETQEVEEMPEMNKKKATNVFDCS